MSSPLKEDDFKMETMSKHTQLTDTGESGFSSIISNPMQKLSNFLSQSEAQTQRICGKEQSRNHSEDPPSSRELSSFHKQSTTPILESQRVINGLMWDEQRYELIRERQIHRATSRHEEENPTNYTRMMRDYMRKCKLRTRRRR